MGNVFWDIILFAVIAAVLLYRLRSVLGERSEDDPPSFDMPAAKPTNMPADVVSPQAAAAPALPPQMSSHWASALPNFDLVATATAHHQLGPFAAVDPSFHPADFLDKAKKAFSMVLTAYSEGNKNTLEFLLSASLFTAFRNQIEARAVENETYHITLHNIKRAVVSGAKLEGTMAEITVDFTAEQTVTHKNADGELLGEGDGKRRITHDRWTFARDLRSQDPVWRLIRTEEMDD
jgi:predicted lipid-binding transport protein (Tim44 family)